MHSILLHLDTAGEQRLCNGTHSVRHGAIAQCVALQVQLDARLRRYRGAGFQVALCWSNPDWCGLLQLLGFAFIMPASCSL